MKWRQLSKKIFRKDKIYNNGYTQTDDTVVA